MDFHGRKQQLAFGFPKNSPYLTLFNTKIHKMAESGELMKIIEKHSNENPNCQTSKGKPLGFENIAIVFLIISLGVIASLILCGFEWILRIKKEGKKTSIIFKQRNKSEFSHSSKYLFVCKTLLNYSKCIVILRIIL
jgi:hypothetical protein